MIILDSQNQAFVSKAQDRTCRLFHRWRSFAVQNTVTNMEINVHDAMMDDATFVHLLARALMDHYFARGVFFSKKVAESAVHAAAAWAAAEANFKELEDAGMPTSVADLAAHPFSEYASRKRPSMLHCAALNEERLPDLDLTTDHPRFAHLSTEAAAQQVAKEREKYRSEQRDILARQLCPAGKHVPPLPARLSRRRVLEVSYVRHSHVLQCLNLGTLT